MLGSEQIRDACMFPLRPPRKNKITVDEIYTLNNNNNDCVIKRNAYSGSCHEYTVFYFLFYLLAVP